MKPCSMRIQLVAAAVVLGLFLVAGSSSAQETLSMSVASDILFPVSNFSENYNTGFGGNIQFRYAVEPSFQIGLTTGFFSWAAKDGRLVTDLKGVPIRGLAKYDFATPMYLIAEAGVFVGWTTGGLGGSTTDFNYAIGFGVESRLSKDGDIRFDSSLRYEGVARDVIPMNNIVLRVGVTFTLMQ